MYKYLKLDEVTKMSLKIGVREFKQLGKYEKVVEELEELEQKLRNKKQEKLWKKRRKGDLRSRNTQTCDNETPGDAPKLAKVLRTD